MNLPTLGSKTRLSLWLFLAILTALLVVFPVTTGYQYHAIESVYALGSRLPLFAVLFYAWAGIITILLFLDRRAGEWQRVALLSAFALGIFGFWMANSYYGSHPDELWQMGHVAFLNQTHRLDPGNSALSYFQFPGFHLSLYAISQITGLALPETRIAFMLISGVAFTVILYVLFRKHLPDSRLAALGVLVTLLGANLIYTSETFFWPGNPANVFLVVLLWLLPGEKPHLGWVRIAMLTIVFAVLSITYLPTAIAFVFVALGIYAVQRVARQRDGITTNMIAFLVVMVALWQVYYAVTTLEGIASLPGAIANGFAEFGSRLAASLEIGAAFTGESVPAWGAINRYVWLALIFAAGGLLALWNLRRLHKLGRSELTETGSILAVAVMSVFCIVGFENAAELHRFFIYAPLFAVPLVLRHASIPTAENALLAEGRLKRRRSQTWHWLRRNAVAGLIGLVVVLSVPAFLANNYRMLTHPVYAQEASAGLFLQASFHDGNPTLYSVAYSLMMYAYYLPLADYRPFYMRDTSGGEVAFWREFNQYADTYLRSQDNDAVFVVSQRIRHAYGPQIIVSADDPEWLALPDRLGTAADRVYSNGFVDLYHRASTH